jgi:hypothetical protein
MNIYSFIMWEKSRSKTDQILNDLKKNFVVRNIYEISWSKENFKNNLHRFYGLPDVEKKIEIAGTGPFLLIIISDPTPKFEEKIISNKKELVNINIYESKIKYRKWIGINFIIHSSISVKETNHDLKLLINKNIMELEKELPDQWNGSIEKLKLDLIGHDGWNDLNQLFSVLNETTEYVVFRNFDDILDEIDYSKRDIDILAENKKIAYILDSNFFNSAFDSHFHNVKVNKKEILFDLAYVGSHYFDKKWSQDILKRKILHKNGYYVPCIEDNFYTLLYHVIYHKRFSEKYINQLIYHAKDLSINTDPKIIFSDFNKSKKFLKKYMKNMGYRNTMSIQYRIIHTEFQHIIRLSIILLKTEGLIFLLTAIKRKIQNKINLEKMKN